MRFYLAHEAYVLTHQEFQQGTSVTSHNPFGPLFSGHNLALFGTISLFVALSYVLVVIWATLKPAGWLDQRVRRLAVIGPLLIRLAVSISFYYAAKINAVFGPELALDHIHGASLIRYLLFLLAITIFFGLLTRVSAIVGLMIFIYITGFFHSYMLTYLNYFGELLVLVLFGAGPVSLDRLIFKRTALDWGEQNRQLEVPIVRILYGIALMYAGIDVKFLHQSLTVAVYNQYHLINFFHMPAGFVAAGAGLAEIMIGGFIILGLVQRWTVLISLAFITLSLLYFHEMLWPHYLLYGISISLIINSGDVWTADRWLIPWAKSVIRKILPATAAKKVLA